MITNTNTSDRIWCSICHELSETVQHLVIGCPVWHKQHTRRNMMARFVPFYCRLRYACVVSGVHPLHDVAWNMCIYSLRQTWVKYKICLNNCCLNGQSCIATHGNVFVRAIKYTLPDRRVSVSLQCSRSLFITRSSNLLSKTSVNVSLRATWNTASTITYKTLMVAPDRRLAANTRLAALVTLYEDERLSIVT